MRRHASSTGLIALAVLACGGPGSGDGADADGSATNSEDTGESAEHGDGDGEGDGDGDGDGDGEEGPPPQTKFDLGPLPDANTGCEQGGGMDDDAFSYIWVANSSQGTISKIDTETMIEEGRYRVRPDSAGNPSRTSVNLSGDVAVANRAGGITKVHARSEECPESNGQNGLQTSTGANDVLAWGTEECVAWHTPMNVTSQRPVAWDQGDFDEGTCQSVNAKVWTATATGGAITVWKLDGDDGVVEDSTVVAGITAAGYGPYGGAVDGNKDFWFTHRDGGFPYPLVRVAADSLDYTIWPVPQGVNPYGFAVDPDGRPWIAGFQGGIARFDPADETWQVNDQVTGVGMMGDDEGLMWIAHFPWDMEGVSALDTETMQLVDFITVPSSLGKGVSIDFNGYVWLVDMTNSAFRIDPETHDFDVYDGLTGPYTYSDMTGFGLASVTNPQG